MSPFPFISSLLVTGQTDLLQISSDVFALAVKPVNFHTHVGTYLRFVMQKRKTWEEREFEKMPEL